MQNQKYESQFVFLATIIIMLSLLFCLYNSYQGKLNHDRNLKQALINQSLNPSLSKGVGLYYFEVDNFSLEDDLLPVSCRGHVFTRNVEVFYQDKVTKKSLMLFLILIFFF